MPVLDISRTLFVRTSSMRTMFVRIGLGITMLAAAGAGAHAAEAKLEGGTVTLTQGESATFPISGGGNGPANLDAQCDISDVSGSASITFDGEYYVPLSSPAVGDVITLSRGDTRSYQLAGVVDSQGRDAYVAFRFGGAAAAMCFPGMDCSGAEGEAGSVTISCRNAS